jgi:3-oxoacyl-[acyl-carrier-protein] synthase II
MRERRVVITGMGWVTPLGSGVDSVWSKLLAGGSGVGPVTRYDAGSFKTNFAAEVKDFRLEHFLDVRAAEFAETGLSTKFALAAAAQAWKQSGIESAVRSGRLSSRRFGVYLGAGEGSLDFDNYVGTNLAGWVEAEKRLDTVAWAKAGLARMSAVREIEQEPNLTVSHVARAFGCRGPASNCMTACAAGAQSVGEAVEVIRSGEADAMLAGGAHSMIHPFGMTGFIRLTAMSTRRDDPTHAARPFDRTRDGFVMGEGAGMLVLESLDGALARGATPLAEIAGYGSSADAYRITDIAPEHRGAQAAIRQALAQGGIDPRALGPDGRPGVHWFCAHGTGTSENDKAETAALKALFGDHAGKVPVSSIKSMLGHLIQAAGTVGTIACVQAVRTGFIPPTANYSTPDPDCDLDVVPNTARDLRDAGGVEACLNNSAGFGGQNDVLLIRRYRA